MKRLIVNADDLGADQARNEGIFAAMEAGTVTSVSLLANGPALEHALEYLRTRDERSPSVGVHLNLSEGAPVASGLHILTGADRLFRGKVATQDLLQSPTDGALQEELAREIEAQISRLEGFGLSLRHLDGHQHVHLFPAALGPVLKAAVAHGIPWIRIPDEVTSEEPGDLSGAAEREATAFARAGKRARGQLRGLPLQAPDRFLGLRWKGRLSLETMERAVQELPPGLTELMVHPGRARGVPEEGPFRAFATRDRERELAVLLDPALPTMLTRQRVVLTPFPP